MLKYQPNQNNSGMALVTVIIVSTMAMIIIVASLTLSTLTNQANTQFMQGQQALLIAETGAENALLRLLRDPEYAGEILTLSGGTAKIEVSNENGTKLVSVTGSTNLAVRQIHIRISDENGMMKIESWRESN